MSNVGYVATMKAGTGVGVSVIEVITLVNQLAGGRSRILSKPSRPGESMRAVAVDASKRFGPADFAYTSLAAGVQEMMANHATGI